MAQDVVRVVSRAVVLPKLFARDKDAGRRFIEFFTANIRNPNTRRAYARAAVEFAVWCEHEDLRELADIEPVHIAAYIETLQLRLAAPSVKQHLAAIRMLFDWLVVGQVITDYLVEKRIEKLRNALRACGLLDRYEAGSVNDSDFAGKRGKLKLGIEKGKKGYPDKNVVTDYVCDGGASAEAGFFTRASA